MPNDQNRPSASALKRFLQEKGFYIVLSLCILAVGVTGYIFVSGAIAEEKTLNEATLSVATPAEIPSQVPATQKPAASKPAAGKPSATPSDKPEEEQTTQVIAPALPQMDAGKRVWPVSGEALADYSMAALSYNPTTRDWRTHDGVDLAAAVGAQVQAAAAGTVTAVYEDEYLGTTIVLTHPGGYATHYANLSQNTDVSVGDAVSAGQVIGYVGDTALLEAGQAAHLHFAAYQDGESMDPAAFME